MAAVMASRGPRQEVPAGFDTTAQVVRGLRLYQRGNFEGAAAVFGAAAKRWAQRAQ